jgi:hypothetical protein
MESRFALRLLCRVFATYIFAVFHVEHCTYKYWAG